MYPLDERHILVHVINRVAQAEIVDNTVVATSTQPPDDIVERCASTAGADVVRGSESDVLSRFHRAAKRYNPDVLVRVTADCPLISPKVIDTCIKRIVTEGVDYAFAGLERTFPRGITCEAFTAESFQRIVQKSTESRHKEHVTPYYREHPEQFELYNLESTEIFDKEWLQNRTDLRLTLDEPADYHLLETVYREVEYTGILDICDAIQYIDENNLAMINQHVEQKSV
jgi:spore coat polysaccharide biosynthesis protein SpsF